MRTKFNKLQLTGILFTILFIVPMLLIISIDVIKNGSNL
jgi:hypothetical protein